jgi:hypothetical protein
VRGEWGFTLDEQEIEEHPGETSLVPRLDDAVRPKARGPAPKQKSLLLETIAQAIDEAGVPITPFAFPAMTTYSWNYLLLSHGASSS